MTEKTATIKLPAGSLASRDTARPIRHEILEQLGKSSSGEVNIDLSEVLSISGSFADECIGVLVMQVGFEQLLKRLRLVNGSKNVVRSIASAIFERKKRLDATYAEN